MLDASPRGSVVNVVSSFASDYDANDLEWQTRRWNGFKAYKQSKQALRMLTWGLAASAPKLAVNAAAPEFVKTDFNQNAHGFVAAMIGFSAKLFAVSPEKGADTPLWVATELDGQTGKYFEGRKQRAA